MGGWVAEPGNEFRYKCACFMLPYYIILIVNMRNLYRLQHTQGLLYFLELI